jgi:hypothetical protein
MTWPPKGSKVAKNILCLLRFFAAIFYLNSRLHVRHGGFPLCAFAPWLFIRFPAFLVS